MTPAADWWIQRVREEVRPLKPDAPSELRTPRATGVHVFRSCAYLHLAARHSAPPGNPPALGVRGDTGGAGKY